MQLNERQDGQDSRKNPRTVINDHIDVNGGRPYRGGRLKDMSVGGAAVAYPPQSVIDNEPIGVDDEIILVINGRARVPGRVVRLFDGGFAVRFDWSIDIEWDRFGLTAPLPSTPTAG